MADKKIKRTVPRRAEAGASRFTLPKREERERDASFVGELLDAASAQESDSMPSQTSLTRHTVAPERDFAKVPNSITRTVIPAGEFKGKSKQLYDCLYSLTRGAIHPVRSVRISRPQLMKKAGIGARVTFDTNITHLSLIGLLQVKHIAGEHEGNEYTVYLPEERTLPSQTSQTSLTSHAQDQDRLVRLESSQTRHTLSVENTDSSDNPKTSFKTKEENIDDEATRRFVEIFRQAERELTGKASTSADKWNELADLLVTELKIAAARTTVSNVPAFLTEHLRRRLWKVDKERAIEIAVESEAGSKPQVLNTEEKRTCPDCAGTNFWYPEGPDKGVARCRHAKLISTPADKQ